MNKYAAHILAIRNDFCLEEMISSFQDTGMVDPVIFLPDECWNGSPINKEDEKEVRGIAKKRKVTVVPMRMKQLIRRDMTYIMKEAVIRNGSMNTLRFMGYNHALIVDADELWRPGALTELDYTICSNPKIGSITMRSIPVVGIPAYPVDSKQEGLLCYVRIHHSSFISGRSYGTMPYAIDKPYIFHFTATGRSKEEVVEKMRRSSHYDDPENYAMEDWIRKKFPNLKPGEKDCHMFTKQVIWDKVRKWKGSELADIPESLRGYMGS